MEIFDVSPPFSLSQLTLNFRIEFASNRHLTSGHQQAWQRTSQLRPNNPSVRPSIKQLCIRVCRLLPSTDQSIERPPMALVLGNISHSSGQILICNGQRDKRTGSIQGNYCRGSRRIFPFWESRLIWAQQWIIFLSNSKSNSNAKHKTQISFNHFSNSRFDLIVVVAAAVG